MEAKLISKPKNLRINKKATDTQLMVRIAHQITQDHCILPPQIQQIAADCGMSMSKFKTLFKEINGDTYYNYFLKYRLTVAAAMLKEGSKVGEIADIFGYSQSIKFLVIFKKYYGITPKQYQLKNVINCTVESGFIMSFDSKN